MLLRDQIQALSEDKGYPCITISLHTHRTHPDSKTDIINLKNLAKEAEERLLKEFQKREVAKVMENLDSVVNEIDPNYNLDGLYVFASANTHTFIRTDWAPAEDRVVMDEQFALRDLIKASNRSESYLILYLSQADVHLYEALDEHVLGEIHTHHFPFKENPYYTTDKLDNREPGRVNNRIREYFNHVDKALIEVLAGHELPVIVASTSANFDFLLQVADRPSVYIGHIVVDPHQRDAHHLGAEAWEMMKEEQKNTRTKAIDELMAAVPAGKVITDIQEIWRASREGRGDLLLVNNDYHEAASIAPDGTLIFPEDAAVPGVIDDIVNDIAWEVLSQKGRVYFTDQPELEQLGKIALKVRY